MLRIFGAALAAATLAWANSASAAIVTIDFDDRAPGSSASYGGEGYNLGANIITPEGHATGRPHYPGETYISLYGGGRYGQYSLGNMIYAPELLSLDVYFDGPGKVVVVGGLHYQNPTEVGPGWTTLSNITDLISDCRFRCMLLLKGEGAMVDNVTFDTRSASVPEPQTWALLISGFALAGSAIRTQRRRLGALL